MARSVLMFSKKRKKNGHAEMTPAISTGLSSLTMSGPLLPMMTGHISHPR